MKSINEIINITRKYEKENLIGLPFVIKGNIYIFSYKNEIASKTKNKLTIINLYLLDTEKMILHHIGKNVHFIAYTNKLSEEKPINNITEYNNLFLYTYFLGKTICQESIQKYINDESYLLYPSVYKYLKKDNIETKNNICLNDNIEHYRNNIIETNKNSFYDKNKK